MPNGLQWTKKPHNRTKIPGTHKVYKTRLNNPQSAYAQHILNNRHEYGPINDTMSLLKQIKKLHCYYHTNNYISKHINITSSLFQNKAQANINPYTSWSVTHSSRHFLRDQPINTHQQQNKTSSILILLESCLQIWYVNTELYYIGRNCRISWNTLLF
jgi:hypothetical protein